MIKLQHVAKPAGQRTVSTMLKFHYRNQSKGIRTTAIEQQEALLSQRGWTMLRVCQ